MDLVPLLPQFLQRRRTKLDFVLRAMEELGVDRPAYLTGVSFFAVGEDGLSEDEFRGPYRAAADRVRPALAAARAAGLIEERGGRYRISALGREHAARLRRATHEHFATLVTVAEDDLARLADVLERAFQAACAAPGPPKARTYWAAPGRALSGPPNALAKLDDAIVGLWYFRDDCHIAAWREAGFDGVALDALTRVWREEAATLDELMAKLPQESDEVRVAMDALRERGLVERADPLRVTPAGREARQRIEDETDRYFFAPWPDEVGTQAGWLVEQLGRVNAALG